MTLKDFTEILDTFGSRPANWPDQHRSQWESFLASDAGAQQLFKQQQTLEDLLQKLEAPELPYLETRILNQELPPQQISIADKLIEWLLPSEFGIQLWRPTVAACLPLVFGILVGNYFSFGITEQDQQLEYWDDELALLSFNDFSSELSETGF